MAAGSGAGSLPRNSFSAPALMTGRWSVLRAGGVFTGGGSVQGEARTGLLPPLKIPTSKRQCHLRRSSELPWEQPATFRVVTVSHRLEHSLQGIRKAQPMARNRRARSSPRGRASSFTRSSKKGRRPKPTQLMTSYPIRKTAPATERGRSRTRPPSLPERTIHPPSAVRPVIMPTW
jgi:hypothetical protein